MPRGKYTRRRDMGAPGRKRQFGGYRRKYMYKRGGKPRQPVQFFTRTDYGQAVFTAQTGTGTGYGLSFQLSNVPNFGEFTTLYDQYCIKAVKITIKPNFTNNQVFTGATPGGWSSGVLGNMWSVIDYDDVVSPLNVGELLQYQNVKHTRLDKFHKRYLKPMLSLPTVTGGVAPKRSQWLDCNNASVPHLGIKLWLDQIVGEPGTKLDFDYIIKYYLAFKNVR